jgi:hypothetical protein
MDHPDHALNLMKKKDLAQQNELKTIPMVEREKE